jgi:hypothetical protein
MRTCITPSGLFVLCCLWPVCTRAATLPTTLYEEWRKSPVPVDGSTLIVNPPSLQWASVKHWERRDVLYRVELSDNPTFPPDKSIRGPAQRWCFYNPHARLKPGTWYWRYEIQEGSNRTIKGPYSFQVLPTTPVFATPTFAEFLANIPRHHPRVITQGRDLAAIRKSAATHPLAGDIIRQGKKAAMTEIYDGPLSDPDQAKSRTLERRAGREVKSLHTLVEAHVLSDDMAMRDALLKRIEVVLKWPTSDLLGSQVLTTLSETYDALGDDLPPEVRHRMLAVIEKQLRKGLSAWPGNIEGRQVENHFWQAELPGNFTAALATVHDLEASREMLEYTYELFLARFPNLATADGGWAEGLGYFGVNKSAVVDMAVLLKKVGQVDVFTMRWYQSLPDYFIYFAPIGGRIDGFGDMHDRVGNGNIGQAMMFVLGQETNDPKALYRAAALTKAGPAAEDDSQPDSPIEPWYQIVNDLRPGRQRISPPGNLPQARMFSGVGLAALHTDVLDSSRDTAVYFRSSPFGAKGHMHANQNAFNLSRRGEPLFCSTGYYTSFADPHSISSYRHTRAHNTVLVDGCGQAFGHEGYGWIKRFAAGRRISYVCGDATMAYRPTVDEQFLGMLAECKIAPTPANGYGDGKLKLFERHVTLIRPDTVVIYDVLESEQAAQWTLLLHTMKEPSLDRTGRLRLHTGKNVASARVLGSQELTSSVSDQFHSPPVDVKKKYKNMPPQYHVTYSSKEKSTTMRFLTVLQLASAGTEPELWTVKSSGTLAAGGVQLRAELDAAGPPGLSVETDAACLYIDRWPKEVLGHTLPTPNSSATLLVERDAGQVAVTVAEDMPPTR